MGTTAQPKRLTSMAMAVQFILQHLATGDGSPLTIFDAMALGGQCQSMANATLRMLASQGYFIIQRGQRPWLFHASPPVRQKLMTLETVTPIEAKSLTATYHAQMLADRRQAEEKSRLLQEQATTRVAAAKTAWYRVDTGVAITA